MSEKTNSTTAKLATQSGVLPLRSLQLIGTVTSENTRRALLRQADRKIKTVSVGDKLRQGTVVAIDEGIVILNTTNGTHTLRIPTAPQPRAAA
ncbi:pilus assembly protein PilP [Tateyamaria sp. Alg231-49]|uniref:pilus assembly protein PilP n=1 Tax=Tateyamaria sp. Alg231-49 TaxID=1922219 RepID=UPI00131F0004|nr:pilus assembly protein PilP [Tateyamaria sp. Alg231-49]